MTTTREDEKASPLYDSNDDNTLNASNPPSDLETNKPNPQGNGAPDGGITAWMVVIGAWCCCFSSFGWINTIGSFQEYYENGPLSDYSSSTVAWIPSLQLFFIMAMGPLVGKIYDNYGPRHLIIAGTILHVFGLMMASLATKYYQFMLSQGVCSAIGVAALFQPALTSISTWFDKKRGAAMGIMATGSSIGGVIFPILISRMIRKNGYPWAMRTAAFLILGLQVIACLTVRPRIQPQPKSMSVERLAAPFKEHRFVILLAGLFVLTFGMYVPLDYIPLQGVTEAHMSSEMSQYLVAILNAGSLFGRLGAGYAADKAGRWNMFIVAGVVSGISILAVWIPAKTSAGAIGFSVFFGFASGAYVSLLGALPAAVSPLPEIGYRTGIVFLVISVPALTTSPIAGAILQHTGNWLNLKIFSGIMFLAGSAVIMVARLLYTERRLLAIF